MTQGGDTVIKRVTVIGGGNVACHLVKALSRSFVVSQTDSRTLSGLDRDGDVYIVCVSDSAIAPVARRIADVPGIVAHTSGSTPMDILAQSGCHRYGVLYPLQTFSKEVELDYDKIPVFVEGCNAESSAALSELATGISANVHVLDSERRKIIHLASVLACNFTNHLWTLAYSLLSDNDIPPQVLRPLIDETVAKLDRTSPLLGQTGPARRGDRDTINAHLKMLADNPGLAEIYAGLSDSIINLYRKK